MIPKKNKNKNNNKKKTKDSSDSLNLMKLISKLAGGVMLLLISYYLIDYFVRFTLFKYDSNSCNNGDQSTCDKLLNYDRSYDLLYENAESITNPYFKKIYDEYQSNKEYQLNKLFNRIYAKECIASMGERKSCSNVETKFLDDDLLNLVKPFIEKHKRLNYQL